MYVSFGQTTPFRRTSTARYVFPLFEKGMPMNAYANAMRRYFDFRGRSTRSQFWLFFLVYGIIIVAAVVVDAALGTSSKKGPSLLLSIVYLVHAIPSLAVSVRRLHDIDRTGWWVLISVVPLLGLIVMGTFATKPSTPGTNRFGTNGSPAAKDAAGEPFLSPHTPVGPDLDRLEKLAALKASGAIDDDEYRQMKADLLSRTTR